MGSERDGYDSARRLQESQRGYESERATVAHQDDDEDWPMLTALLAGLTVALIANTFFGLIPG